MHTMPRHLSPKEWSSLSISTYMLFPASSRIRRAAGHFQTRRSILTSVRCQLRICGAFGALKHASTCCRVIFPDGLSAECLATYKHQVGRKFQSALKSPVGRTGWLINLRTIRFLTDSTPHHAQRHVRLFAKMLLFVRQIVHSRRGDRSSN